MLTVYQRNALTVAFCFVLTGPIGFSQNNHAKDHHIGKQSEGPVTSTVFFRSIDENIPVAVKKVKEESLVAVRAEVPHWEEGPGMHHDYFYGAGFVPAGWDGYVLTCLHLMSAYPAVWVDEAYPLIVQVFDGHNAFEAKMISFNSRADLALLQVISGSEGEKFRSKPAVMTSDSLTDPKKSPRSEKFYVFSFFPRHPNLFFTLEIGPLRTVSNAFYESSFPLGIIQGGVEHGFSGGPVLTTDGVVMGLLVKTSAAFSYMVLVETIDMFLDESRKLIEVKSEEKR